MRLQPRFLEEIDRGDERAAGRQHGIKDNGDALVDLLGELHVVLYGLQRLFVPVQADDADLRARDHVQHAVHQAEPARRMGTMVTILPEMDSTSTGPASL